MKFKPVLSAALLLSVVTLSSTMNTNQAVAQSNQKAYCTAASNKGISYYAYGGSSIADDCFSVFQKVLNAGHSVDRAEWGYYKTSGQNTGKISCIQGQKTVRGNGGDFFVNASNMRVSSGWSGCTFKVTS
ncbi:hypothetical protein [Calothrix sp. UHCC 0171]|uniref:hypothetical protein n=1 Tax=Calothrix sp. UHCC 0171 TaxID=3110245 RepID=UPI002B1F25A1|nr:hypothetical protein [Calothrix sp. UHCC 0171]MEA5572498.1 hypothetical protein [Calothrix sp. UHCC 0171]